MANFSRYMTRGLLSTLAFWAASQAHSAEVEPKSGDVPVYADATNKSGTVATLRMGERLQLVERKGMFWQVKTTDGKVGFVSVLQVKHKPDASSGLAEAIKSAVKDGRSGDEVTAARTRSAVMGVRGLREDDSAGKAGDVRPNLRAVYDMEDKIVSEKKISELGEKVFQEVVQKSGQ